MNNRQKGSMLVVVAIIIAVGLIGTLTYVMMKNGASPKTPVTVTKAATTQTTTPTQPTASQQTAALAAVKYLYMAEAVNDNTTGTVAETNAAYEHYQAVQKNIMTPEFYAQVTANANSGKGVNPISCSQNITSDPTYGTLTSQGTSVIVPVTSHLSNADLTFTVSVDASTAKITAITCPTS